MANLLGNFKDFYNRVEALKGRELAKTLLILFPVFVLFGLFFGYFILLPLNKGEFNLFPSFANPAAQEVSNTVVMEGKVAYINPNNNPGDNISYVLEDAKGKELIFLKANDQKLAVAEGLSVRVTGLKVKTPVSKKDVLVVEEITINSGTQ